MAINKAVTKTLKILELISKSSTGITLSEICKELDLPKATVFDILQALYTEDAVYYKNEVAKTYVIGSKLFMIGQSYTKNSNFIAFAEPLLQEFANKYGVTTFGCKRLGTKTNYVYKYESSKTRIATSDIGVQLPLYETVAGIAFLTFLPKEKREDLLQRILTKDFNNKETKKYKEILEKIERYKSIGYVIDNGESDRFICDLAIPVYNFEDHMTGAIFASRLVIEDDPKDLDKYIKEFLAIAEVISYKQGYRK